MGACGSAPSSTIGASVFARLLAVACACCLLIGNSSLPRTNGYLSRAAFIHQNRCFGNANHCFHGVVRRSRPRGPRGEFASQVLLVQTGQQVTVPLPIWLRFAETAFCAAFGSGCKCPGRDALLRLMIVSSLDCGSPRPHVARSRPVSTCSTRQF